MIPSYVSIRAYHLCLLCGTWQHFDVDVPVENALLQFGMPINPCGLTVECRAEAQSGTNTIALRLQEKACILAEVVG